MIIKNEHKRSIIMSSCHSDHDIGSKLQCGCCTSSSAFLVSTAGNRNGSLWETDPYVQETDPSHSLARGLLSCGVFIGTLQVKSGLFYVHSGRRNIKLTYSHVKLNIRVLISLQYQTQILFCISLGLAKLVFILFLL